MKVRSRPSCLVSELPTVALIVCFYLLITLNAQNLRQMRFSNHFQRIRQFPRFVLSSTVRQHTSSTLPQLPEHTSSTLSEYTSSTLPEHTSLLLHQHKAIVQKLYLKFFLQGRNVESKIYFK